MLVSRCICFRFHRGEGKHHKEPMRTQSKMNCSKRGKTQVTKLRFLFGPAFDWLKEWASFCLNSKL